MTKYIALHRSVTRCRPQPPLSKLHKDCGMQSNCARHMAANVHCDPTRDFSLSATPIAMAMLCTYYVAIPNAESYRDAVDTKPMQSPT